MLNGKKRIATIEKSGCNTLRDHRTIARARKFGNANERPWQPHWLSVWLSAVRVCESDKDKQNNAVRVLQPSC